MCHAPDTKIVYRRYASLFFIAGCASDDNELITLEIIHRYVEQMDKYYGNVCELDIIFSFTKAYYILDELLLAGELQESSKKNVLRCISQQDSLEDMEVSGPATARQTNPSPVLFVYMTLRPLLFLMKFLDPVGIHGPLIADVTTLAPRLRTKSQRSCRDTMYQDRHPCPSTTSRPNELFLV